MINEFKAKIDLLVSSLKVKEELVFIQETLRKNPEVAYQLSEEEIGKIVGAFRKESNVVLNSPKPTKSVSAKYAKVDLNTLSI